MLLSTPPSSELIMSTLPVCSSVCRQLLLFGINLLLAPAMCICVRLHLLNPYAWGLCMYQVVRIVGFGVPHAPLCRSRSGVRQEPACFVSPYVPVADIPFAAVVLGQLPPGLPCQHCLIALCTLHPSPDAHCASSVDLSGIKPPWC